MVVSYDKFMLIVLALEATHPSRSKLVDEATGCVIDSMWYYFDVAWMSEGRICSFALSPLLHS
jgi:hypothetical protein